MTKFIDLHNYIKETQLYKTLISQHNELDEIPINISKQIIQFDLNIDNEDLFIDMFHKCKYWNLSKFPPGILIYAYRNKPNILRIFKGIPTLGILNKITNNNTIFDQINDILIYMENNNMTNLKLYEKLSEVNYKLNIKFGFSPNFIGYEIVAIYPNNIIKKVLKINLKIKY